VVDSLNKFTKGKLAYNGFILDAFIVTVAIIDAGYGDSSLGSAQRLFTSLD